MSETENTASEIGSATSSEMSDADTLVVVSKVKKYVRAQSGLNTGQCAIDALTRKVIEEISRGVENARKAGRKTLMGRDIL